MELFDTHCHIHEITKWVTGVHDKWADGGITDVEAMLSEAKAVGVSEAICVGTTLEDSELAVEFVQDKPGLYASVGIHPHEAKDYVGKPEKIAKLDELAGQDKVVAIGECGLDYHYTHSPKEAQIEVLRAQIELAVKYDLPITFHVSDAFDDFWPIFDRSEARRVGKE